MSSLNTRDFKRGQRLHIIQAALEYLIAILVGGSFLATLTKELGFSDSLTGILSSVISLGCLFQMLSVFFRRRHYKSFVLILSIVNQLLFLLLYAIPLFDIPSSVKTGLFVVFIFTAYLIYNMAHPRKINWLMSLVDDRYRGLFTANKEIVSLITGMIFTYVMGSVVDHFSAHNNLRTSFIISGIVIFVLMLLHTVIMLLTPEPDIPDTPKKSVFQSIRELAGNPNIIHVTAIFVLYYISTYVATPFYSTYLIGELGFNLKLISIFGIISSITRILVSRFWGAYADKTSFTIMIQKCLMILGIGYCLMILATPATGHLMYLLYCLFHGAALGGINSALINLIYDYVAIEKRADSLAVCQAASGLSGFLATLAASTLVSYIQNSGNHFLGIPLYAQQLVSLISALVVFGAILYIKLIILKRNQ